MAHWDMGLAGIGLLASRCLALPSNTPGSLGNIDE